MLFRGKTFQEAVNKGLKYFDVTHEMAEIYLVKGTNSEEADSVDEFVVEVSPVSDIPANVDGNFRLLYREDGVYLKVNPPLGDGDGIKTEDIKSKLEYKKVKDVDEAALVQAVNAKESVNIKIAPCQLEVKYPATLAVEIANDDKSAYAVMIPPDGGDPLTEDRAVSIINENGVSAGLDRNNIKDMVTKNVYGIPIQVARAVEPQDGENGYVEYNVDVDKKRKLSVSEDGTVDFHELGLIENVRTGQILAKLIPPTEGTDGQDVKGNPIKAKAGTAARLPKGKNTEITEDKDRLVALKDGQVNFSNGKLNIYPVYEVPGNVDNSTGNIRFVGKVVVRGNVLTGFEIHAEGDIEVNGVVEGARLVSGGNIILKRGAQGRGKGVLVCEGSLVSKFIENCKVETGGDIVAEAIMHSVLSSKSAIELKGKKGLLVGGNVAARNEIRAKTIGSPMATTTLVEVGVDPELRKNMDLMVKKMEKEKRSLEQVNFNISLIAKMAKKGYVPENKKVLLKKCVGLKAQLEENIKQNETGLARIKEQLNTISKGRVTAEKVVYPGTVINIGSSTMHVKDPLEYVSFYRAGGEIKLGSFEK
ncbi:MAG: FapA family protein [Firmicutes bacterium]|nr:FapA family protein [Bacillota bacterium]MDD3297313.1 FapA family protein [Bacillota bacterium]MDD3850106.1 FapA family protein [Bacillota bacterium]